MHGYDVNVIISLNCEIYNPRFKFYGPKVGLILMYVILKNLHRSGRQTGCRANMAFLILENLLLHIPSKGGG